MPKYLFQWSYTSGAWAALVKNPENRIEMVRKVIEKLGGKLECAYITFGDYDGMAVMEMPDNVSVAAFAISTASGGSLKNIKTTTLMSFEEAIDAMKKAGSSGYTPLGN